ncbi:hypothetical protein F5Y16DRAFT_393547 [Xylariaceae sp. FL0255]|nr:hypothetical protein F5Y16DRAFT_393547 [Xylariaceae sp. FL0255]
MVFPLHTIKGAVSSLFRHGSGQPGPHDLNNQPRVPSRLRFVQNSEEGDAMNETPTSMHPDFTYLTVSTQLSLANTRRMEQSTERNSPRTPSGVLTELGPLREFVATLVNRPCWRCGSRLITKPDDVINLTRQWMTPNPGGVVLGKTCHSDRCAQMRPKTCLGCGKWMNIAAPVNMLSHGTIFVSEKSVEVFWCCNTGKLVALWTLACGWPETPQPRPTTNSGICGLKRPHSESSHKKKDGSSKHSASRVTKNTRSSPVPAGTGYEGIEHYLFSMPLGLPGLPGAPAVFAPRGKSGHQIPSTAPMNLSLDYRHETFFKLVNLLLPFQEAWKNIDNYTFMILRMVLSHSPLVQKATALLSCESITEMTRRFHLSKGVLDFVHTLPYHTPGTFVLAPADLHAISFKDIYTEHKPIPHDLGRCLITLPNSLTTQARNVLMLASKAPSSFSDGDKEIILSKLILRISNYHTLSRKAVPEKQVEVGVKLETPPMIDQTTWHRENCVKDVPDETILAEHTYLNDVHSGTSGRGRLKRLINELSNLHTSLPEGIFIRHGASRVDVMKVLIIGPRGTPYEHGLFEFDMFCTMNYPNEPPKMKLRTTNLGRVRFNPNLYENGTVCLSLLGTWPGESWKPTTSTILQVLVSIQSMIFCEKPWYNEPGYESIGDDTRSLQYNLDTRCSSLQYAIIPWALGIYPEESKPTLQFSVLVPRPAAQALWKDTISLHLWHNTIEIIESTRKAISSSSQLKNVAVLEDVLRRFHMDQQIVASCHIINKNGYVAEEAKAAVGVSDGSELKSGSIQITGLA